MKRLIMISLLAVLSVCMNARAVQSLTIDDCTPTLSINLSSLQEACVYTGITASFAFVMSTNVAQKYAQSVKRWNKRYEVMRPAFVASKRKEITQSHIHKTPNQETPGASVQAALESESALRLCEQEKNYVQRMYTAARYGTYISAAVAIGSFAAAALLNEC